MWFNCIKERNVSLGGTNLSPIRYCSLWEWAEELMCDHTHYGTPFLRPSAYKARVGGVSPQCGIEQICEGGIGFSAHSQNEQYLIGKKFVPPTVSN